jgi:hypothetical protein
MMKMWVSCSRKQTEKAYQRCTLKKICSFKRGKVAERKSALFHENQQRKCSVKNAKEYSSSFIYIYGGDFSSSIVRTLNAAAYFYQQYSFASNSVAEKLIYN